MKIIISFLLIFLTSCEFDVPLRREVKRTVSQDTSTFTLRAATVFSVDLSISGVPHVPIIFPVVNTSKGYNLYLNRNAEKELLIQKVHLDSVPTKEELEKIINELEISLSPNADRIRITIPNNNGKNLLLALLDKGPPFFAATEMKDENYALAQLNWHQIPSASDIVIKMLSGDCDKNRPDFWNAIEAQSPGGFLDKALIDAWPDCSRKIEIQIKIQSQILKLINPDAKTDPLLKEKLGAKAFSIFESSDDVKKDLAFDVIVASENPDLLNSLDKVLVNKWPESSSDHFHLLKRLRSTNFSKENKLSIQQKILKVLKENPQTFGQEILFVDDLCPHVEIEDCQKKMLEKSLLAWPQNGSAHDVICRNLTGSYQETIQLAIESKLLILEKLTDLEKDRILDLCKLSHNESCLTAMGKKP